MIVGQGGLWLTSIVELATVVGCREQGDQLSLREELVTILNNLVDIRVKIDFLTIRNLFFIPGELCISSRSRVCEGTWQPPSRKSGCHREFQKFSSFSPPLQMWMKRLCHFHPTPLCPNKLQNYGHVGRVHMYFRHSSCDVLQGHLDLLWVIIPYQDQTRASRTGVLDLGRLWASWSAWK